MTRWVHFFKGTSRQRQDKAVWQGGCTCTVKRVHPDRDRTRLYQYGKVGALVLLKGYIQTETSYVFEATLVAKKAGFRLLSLIGMIPRKLPK